MQLPALSIRQPDIAGIMNRLSEQKNQQFRNNLLQRQGERAERALALDETKYRYERKREAEVSRLTQGHFAGDKDAMAALARLDSKRAKEVYDLTSNIGEDERKQRIAENEQVAAGLNWVMQGEPTQRPERFQQMRQYAIANGISPESIPAEYDETWMTLQIATTLGLDQQLKLAEPQSGAGDLQSDIDKGLVTLEQVGEQAKAGRAGESAVTPTQSANSIEIDTARRQLEALAADLPPGVSLRDEVNRRATKQSDTGRANPDFDPTILRAWNNATQRKVGNDPGYERFLASATTAAPEPLPVDAPPAEPEGPGLIDRALDFMGIGDADAAPLAAPRAIRGRTAIASPATPGQPPDVSGGATSVTRTRTSLMPGGSLMRGGVQDVPLTADSLVDVTRLTEGKTYRIPSPDGDFDVVRWNGRSFEPVN